MPQEKAPNPVFVQNTIMAFVFILIYAGLSMFAIAYHYSHSIPVPPFRRSPTDNLKSQFLKVITYSVGLMGGVILIFMTFKGVV
jgi:hypothetical protein